ncbi:MAG TPA: carboxypeptidase-like regulatory domain-containing protein, partial [Pyrinomonadaceae bacterium]|nr:carboxypeptidase-like regulatory domain-containing protein [Pyrinomonadaceae bacterium]
MRRVALLSLLTLCLPLSAFGQQATNATLTGTITDPHGAVISGASVTATHKATGVKRDTTTNDSGLYVLSNMPPGDYELKVAAQGFTSEVSKTDISLKVGQTVTLNVTLEIGLTESMVIDFTTPPQIIDNSDSLIHGIIESREVESLPLNGRNFLELALLVPGNTPAPNFDPTKTNTVVISSAGQLGRGGNVTIDGVDTNDDVVGGAIQNISQEAIQEFQIATNRFSAQLGRS